MQHFDVSDDDLKAEKATENKVKKTLELATKYNVSEGYIDTLISLNLYKKSQKNSHQKFSVIKDLLSSYFGFECSSDMCGDGTAEYAVVAVTPFTHIVQESKTYNCCGINMCTVAEKKKVEKALMKYENNVRNYRKPVALGEKAKKKPKLPNFLGIIEDGALICSNSEDQTFSVRFLKPQIEIGAEKTIISKYCDKHKCFMRNDFGENKTVYHIDGEDFIKTAERIIKEKDSSGGRIFSDVNIIAEDFIKEFAQRKPDILSEFG